VEEIAYSYWLGPKRLFLGGENMASGFEKSFNAPSTLTSLVPGASMLTTAAVLAEFYEMILEGGTTSEGARLVRSGTLERYLTKNVAGIDRISKSYLVLGRGFLLGWRGPHRYGWWNTGACAGHPGGGLPTLAFCDRRSGVAAAIVTNGNRGLNTAVRRYSHLSSMIRKARGPVLDT
jgi:hypothetical protein